MKFRGVFAVLFAVFLVCTFFAIQPATAQIHRPVEIWPTDGWATSTPEKQGMNSTHLSETYTRVRTSDADICSMLVVRHGYIVAEEYFKPEIFNVNDTHSIYSVTKSIVSCLIGIALNLGIIDTTSHYLLDFFPYMEIANPSAWKNNITLEDVLMMRSGLDWDESGSSPVDDFITMMKSGNWIQYVLNCSMAAEPGTVFNYNTGASHLLSGIINRTTEMTPLEFADQYLFSHLGITQRTWSTDSQGINFGGSGLTLTPRDMAKIGLLYLNNGTWDGTQIVSEDWVYRSSHGPETPYPPISYGYQWWIDDDNWYLALGYLGQYIYVIPEHDVVVVFTSVNDEGPYEYDLHVRNVIQAITNIYPETDTSTTGTNTPITITTNSSQTHTESPETMTYILIGIASTSVVVVIIVIRLKK